MQFIDERIMFKVSPNLGLDFTQQQQTNKRTPGPG